jgi:hypothetical protein
LVKNHRRRHGIGLLDGVESLLDLVTPPFFGVESVKETAKRGNSGWIYWQIYSHDRLSVCLL